VTIPLVACEPSDATASDGFVQSGRPANVEIIRGGATVALGCATAGVDVALTAEGDAVGGTATGDAAAGDDVGVAASGEGDVEGAVGVAARDDAGVSLLVWPATCASSSTPRSNRSLLLLAMLLAKRGNNKRGPEKTITAGGRFTPTPGWRSALQKERSRALQKPSAIFFIGGKRLHWQRPNLTP